jgi:hypothetical protein
VNQSRKFILFLATALFSAVAHAEASPSQAQQSQADEIMNFSLLDYKGKYY